MIFAYYSFFRHFHFCCCYSFFSCFIFIATYKYIDNFTCKHHTGFFEWGEPRNQALLIGMFHQIVCFLTGWDVFLSGTISNESSIEWISTYTRNVLDLSIHCNIAFPFSL